MRRHLRPRKQWNEEGVASTVGTIMALLVFLTFLSLITNQYVPVWMKDSEAGHMGEALGQIGTFKTNIDLQILAARAANDAGHHYIPVTTYSTVKLGVDGVPIFSQPTQGALVVDASQAPWTIQFQYNVSGKRTNVSEWSCACGGNVVLSVANRYFPQQSVAYENGALIRWQQDGQVIKGEPSFQVLVASTSVHVDFTLIQLFGSGGVAGTTSEGLQSRLIAVDLEAYTNIATDVYANETTLYGPAWYNYFNNTLAKAYNISAAKYQQSGSGFVYTETYASGRPTQLRVDNPIFLVQSLWNSANRYYELMVRFKPPGTRNGVTVLPIAVFTLQHAFVNVAAGTTGNNVGI